MADSHPSTLSLAATVTLDLEAAKGADGKPLADVPAPLPRFTMVANTGAVPMRTEGWKYPVVIDLEGLVIPNQSRPIRMNHDISQGVGHTSTIGVEGGVLMATGVISRDTPAARDVVASAKNGFPWQSSVGASVEQVEFVKAGEAVMANGNSFSGPVNIVRKSILAEISFVDLGADDNTSAKVAAQASQPPASQKGAPSMFEQWLQAKGFTDPAALSEGQKTSLQAMYDAEQAAAKAGPKPDPAARQNLDDIINARRKEDERVAEITRLTAAAIDDRPALVDDFERLARTAIEAKSTVQEFELAILRVRASVGPAVFAARGERGETRTGPKVIEAAVCTSGGLASPEKHFDARTLELAHDRFPHGIGLVELLLMAARENGYTGLSGKDVRGLLRASFGQGDGNGRVQATAFSTLSLPGILSNTANKFLTAGFDAVESAWRAISARGTARDFKQMTTYSLTGGFKYEKVGAGGELKHATVGELSYTNQVETYGKMFAITRQDLINDDLNALTQVPRRLGRGAALSLNEVFWTAFMDNSTFFTTARNNYFEGAATNLQLSSLTTGETLFMNQTDPDGFPTAITPRILLVPNALAVTAANIMNSTMIAGDTTANTVTLSNNPHAGKFTVVSSAYLSNSSITGNSTTAWYLLADPNDLPVIEVAFLNGRDTPTVESAEADFNTLGVQFRGYSDFGVSKQEYRAGVKSKGAA
jgi:hypothetical protein